MGTTGDRAYQILEFLCLLEQYRSLGVARDTGAQLESRTEVREYLKSWLGCDRTLATCWCQDLDLSPGSTYGDAAKRILDTLGQSEVAGPQ